MSKKAILEALRKRAFAARLTMSEVRARAGVSSSTMAKINADPERLSVRVLNKLEGAMLAIEAEQAQQ